MRVCCPGPIFSLFNIIFLDNSSLVLPKTLFQKPLNTLFPILPVSTWFAFKYALRRKAAKLERTNLFYGALARLTRDGGFLIVLIIRLSAIPAHFSTAVFSCCDVNFWAFAIATLFSLPKQIFLVYLGVLLVEDKKDDRAQTISFVSVFALTVAMAVYIWWKMRKIKVVLLEEQEARRALRPEEGGGGYDGLMSPHV